MQNDAPADRKRLGRVPMAVVGCGPTGLAALWHGALEGIEAVGIEVGPAPLHTLRSYMEGLVVISPAWHYEIPGLPLDCRDPDELTREEILHYYARVITYGGLDIRCETRCTALIPRDDRVDVEVDTPDGPGTWEAGNVLLSAWYEPRRLPESGAGSRVRVVHGLRNPSEIAGRRSVVIGGGASAFEQASALMLCGQTVTILVRGELRQRFGSPYVVELLEATTSQVVDRVADVRIIDDGVAYTRHGTEQRIACDAVVVCIGQQISPEVCDILERAGVVSGERLARLRTAPTTDDLVRGRTAPDLAELIQVAARSRPDLWDELFHGVRGIRVIGGALHLGGAHSGVAISIHSAWLAVEALLGREPQRGLERPLPLALLQSMQRQQGKQGAFDVIAPLRPIAIRGWSRTARILAAEQSTGEVVARAFDPKKYLLGRLRSDSTAEDILDLADGRLSVRQIAKEHDVNYDDLLVYLTTLWKSNALSWLPPLNGLAGVRAEGGAGTISSPAVGGESDRA